MKATYRLFSIVLLSLPLVLVAFFWDQLPEQMPMHFGVNRQPDRFGKREDWLGMLLNALLLLLLIRASLLRVAGSQRDLPSAQQRALYLLTAGFVTGVLSLLILQGLYRSPVYADWLPVLLFIAGSGFVFFAMPPTPPVTPTNRTRLHPQATQRIDAVQRIYTLSRLVVARANLLAALLMIFANAADRWSIGIFANVLAYIALSMLMIFSRRKPG